MSTDQLLHFVVRNITYNLTLTGYLVTCYTNNPSHLWLRWTSTIPQKHINTKMVRGAPVGTYIDQCFVVFTDVEQNEPGDTFTHTFTLEPWPSCQRRWFYFWGTVGGAPSPSASAIFTLHRPFYLKAYSDPGTGLATLDSSITRFNMGGTWESIHDFPDGTPYPAATSLYVQIMSYTPAEKYWAISRSLLTFDLTSIPTNHKIFYAALHFKGLGRNDTHAQRPQIAVFEANPASFNDCIANDYSCFGSTPLTNVIDYLDFQLDWNVFTFTQPGLAFIKPASKLAIGLREAKFDAPSIQPTWHHVEVMRFFGASRDHWDSNNWPYLIVQHNPPGV